MRYLLLITLLLCLPIAICADEKPVGYDTPEQAFHAFVSGWTMEDYDLMLAALTPESRARTIVLCVMSFNYVPGDNQKLFREHGIQEMLDGQNEKDSLTDADLIKAVQKINRPGELMKKFRDRQLKMFTALAKADGKEIPAPPTKEERQVLIKSVTLSDIKTTSNTATANVQVAEDAADEVDMPSAVRFLKIDDRWYCDIDS